MIWLASVAHGGVLSLSGGQQSVLIEARYPEGHTVGYRTQIRGWVDAHPGADVRIDAQQDVQVKVARVERNGTAHVESRAHGGVGTLTVDMIHVVAQPLPMPTLTSVTQVAADGRTEGFDLTGATDASAALQQLMGGLATSGAGWQPPLLALDPGSTWEIEIDLPLSFDVPVPAAARATDPDAPEELHMEMQLTGRSRWRFEGWSEVDGVPCAVLAEGLTLGGTSVASTRRRVLPAGMAAERASEICWDARAGELLWQHSVAELVQIGGSRGDKRVRMHMELWVSREDGA